MNRFDAGELPSLGERILNIISTILLWPIFYPLARWGGKEFQNIFHGVFGYIPLVINSFVWALFVYWIYVKIKIKTHNQSLSLAVKN